jgi:hypothetical protein
MVLGLRRGHGGYGVPLNDTGFSVCTAKKGSSGNSGENGEAFLLFSLSSFACPKEETRKWHPSQSWPCGLPLLLAEGGTRKNSGFALKQFPRLFRPRLRGAAGQMGGIPIGTQPSTGEAAEKRICTV